MSPKEPDTRRRKVFDKHLLGLVLGETELDEVRKKLGDPASVLEEERVVVLEYESPKETSIARWKKVQFIFFDDLLMNVTYSEPMGDFTRAALHKVLGQPDETGAEGEEDEGADEEGPSDVFEVELEDDPMLSFVAHYLEGDKVEALSLCADVEDDDGDGEEGEDAGDDAEDAGDDEDADEASGDTVEESDQNGK